MSLFYQFLVVFVIVVFSRGGGVSEFFEMVLEDVGSVDSILRGTSFAVEGLLRDIFTSWAEIV